MKIGYNEATGKGCSTLWEDLILCEQTGFDYIELRLDMLQDFLAKRKLSEITSFFKNSHIQPHAMNALYLYKELFSETDDLQRRNNLMSQFHQGCEIAKEIGSEYFVIVPPLQPDLNGSYIDTEENTFAHCTRILKRLSEIARSYNIGLCFELVGFERSSVRTVNAANRIVEAVNEDNVGFVFDAYNIHLYNETNDFSNLNTVDPAKIFAVHINNADAAITPGQHNRRFCDSGVIDLGNYLSTLKGLGYSGMVSIETFRPEYWKLSPDQVIQEAYRTTKECLQKYNCL